MENIRIDLINEKDRPVVFELLSKLKSHSEETFLHSVDVAEKSLLLAESLGIKKEYLKRLYTAGLLHDVGKLFIGQEILHSQNATDNEKEIIRLGHIVGTKSILADFFDAELVRLAAHHHERLNSSGYPEHLNANKLDILDRILQVADVTSALVLDRSYKEAYEAEQVISILDNLVRRGELDKKCVGEIEKIFLIPLKENAQMKEKSQKGS